MSSATRVWPSRDDYQNAVLNPKRNLKDPRLHSTQVETKLRMGALKLPSPRSGNFGAVYKFSNERQSYALKVFDKAQPDRQLRYRSIDEHLDKQSKSPHLVSFGYEEQGILVNGRWYPALLMDWAEGQLLDDYLDETLRQRGQVDNRMLCQAWMDLMLSLAQRHIAHGDLQHGNIMVMPDGTLKLVDYDGMFVPAMRQYDLTAAEIGLPAYQHPKRDRSYFDERLDNFAALVVFLSLVCVDRDRWQHYHTDDNCLIVREPDLRYPQQSPLLTELSQSPDAPVRKLAVLLKVAAQGSLDAIPSFANVIADGVIKQLLTPSWRPTPHTRNRDEQKARPEPPPSREEQEERSHLLDKLKERQVELTPRQRQILTFLAQGFGDEQIAHALSIQKTTVSGHLSKLQQQAGVITRKDLEVWAISHGFGQIPLPPIPPPAKIEPSKPPPAVLTPGDKLVISYLAEGADDAQIAQRLSVETASVSAYISQIQSKVGAVTRRDLMNWAITNGIKPREPTPPLVPVGELRRFEDGHRHAVRSVAFSPDGRYALSGSFDSYICLWDVKSGKEIRRFKGHGGWFSSGEVMSVGFASDGQRIVSGSTDKTLRLWQVESGQELIRMKGHADAVMSVTFSPDGKHLASGSKDKTVRLWDAQTGQEIRRLEGHGDMVLSVAFSPDGRYLLSGSGDKTIRRWSVESGHAFPHSSGHVGMVCSVACSPNGRHILSGSTDQTVRLWDVADGREIRRFVGHKNAVMSVAFSPDGSRCLSASLDQTVHLWDVATGREIDHVCFTKGGGPCWSVALSPDGRCALYGYGGKHKEGEEGWSPGDNNGVRLWGLPK